MIDLVRRNNRMSETTTRTSRLVWAVQGIEDDLGVWLDEDGQEDYSAERVASYLYELSRQLRNVHRDESLSIEDIDLASFKQFVEAVQQYVEGMADALSDALEAAA